MSNGRGDAVMLRALAIIKPRSQQYSSRPRPRRLQIVHRWLDTRIGGVGLIAVGSIASAAICS
jgi:hypothetical protein